MTFVFFKKNSVASALIAYATGVLTPAFRLLSNPFYGVRFRSINFTNKKNGYKTRFFYWWR